TSSQKLAVLVHDNVAETSRKGDTVFELQACLACPQGPRAGKTLTIYKVMFLHLDTPQDQLRLGDAQDEVRGPSREPRCPERTRKCHGQGDDGGEEKASEVPRPDE